MAELTTRENSDDVELFIASVENLTRRKDALQLLEIMRKLTGDQGSMWGESLVGFGSYVYTYQTGRSVSWFSVGFSPRKQYMVVYIMLGFERFEKELSRLGKHKLGKSCLYINKLADIDLDVLEQLITASLEETASLD